MTEETEHDEDECICPRCERGEMYITGARLHWVCDLCGYCEKIQQEEP
jgi:uncharacterized protein (DUF983 family)